MGSACNVEPFCRSRPWSSQVYSIGNGLVLANPYSSKCLCTKRTCSKPRAELNGSEASIPSLQCCFCHANDIYGQHWTQAYWSMSRHSPSWDSCTWGACCWVHSDLVMSGRLVWVLMVTHHKSQSWMCSFCLHSCFSVPLQPLHFLVHRDSWEPKLCRVRLKNQSRLVSLLCRKLSLVMASIWRCFRLYSYQVQACPQQAHHGRLD